MNSRTYVQRARADAAAATRRRILDATLGLVTEKASPEIVLADVAARAEVSVQTVLRHFGSRDGLFAATVPYAAQVFDEERAAPAGDVPAAIRVIVGHYERRGDTVLRFLAQENDDPAIRAVTDQGRRVHREWVRTVFGGTEATVDLLVVATDLYTWKLLRRDRALSVRQVEARMRRLVEAVLA